MLQSGRDRGGAPVRPNACARDYGNEQTLIGKLSIVVPLWQVVPVNGAQVVLVVQPTKQVLVPALFRMHHVLPGQSVDLVHGFVHQRPLHMPALVPDGVIGRPTHRWGSV